MFYIIVIVITSPCSSLDASGSNDKKEAFKYEAGANGNGITPPDTPKRSQSPRTAGFLPKVPSRSSSPVAIPSEYKEIRINFYIS